MAKVDTTPRSERDSSHNDISRRRAVLCMGNHHFLIRTRTLMDMGIINNSRASRRPHSNNSRGRRMVQGR